MDLDRHRLLGFEKRRWGTEPGAPQAIGTGGAAGGIGILFGGGLAWDSYALVTSGFGIAWDTAVAGSKWIFGGAGAGAGEPVTVP